MLISFYTLFAGFVFFMGTMFSGKNLKKFFPLILAITSASFVSMFDLPDYLSYKELFDSVPILDNVNNITSDLSGIYGEILYTFSASIYKLFDNNFWGFRFLIIFSAVYFKVHFFQKISPFYLLAIMSYFVFSFYVDSYILRQFIASSIIALSILVLLSGHRIWFLILVFFASGFHIIALVALPLLFFVQVHISRRIALFLLFLIQEDFL
jgi:hypothetical protein